MYGSGVAQSEHQEAGKVHKGIDLLPLRPNVHECISRGPESTDTERVYIRKKMGVSARILRHKALIDDILDTY